MLPYKSKAFDWDLKAVHWELWVWKARKIWIDFFGNSWRLGTWHIDQSHWFPNQILLYKFEVFDSGPDGRNQTSSCWEKFEYRDVSLMIALFRNFGLTELWLKAQNHRFFDGVLLYRYKFSESDLKERIEHCILGEESCNIKGLQN